MKPTANDSPAQAEQALTSRAVPLLAGCSYLAVGWAFAYLDRAYGGFFFESVLWLLWALAGFGAGVFHLGRGETAGQIHWKAQGVLGMTLAVFPGLLIFPFVRWVGLVVLIVLGARAAIMKTRRDFYLSMMGVFVVSLLVATHLRADWTLWTYLGPAWLFAALALAWEHASGVALGRGIKAGMTLGFVAAALLLAATLFLFLPRPQGLGFGFLPPGTDAPGLFQQAPGNSAGDGARADGGMSSGGDSGASQAPGQAWKRMFGQMRQDLKDPRMPQWQRALLERLLGWGEATVERLTVEVEWRELWRVTISIPWRLLWALALLLVFLAVLRYWAWPRRFGLGAWLALWAAGRFEAWRPMLSLRCSALAMNWCLRHHGHPRAAGCSVREHVALAATLPALARHWLNQAVGLYCRTRFGGAPATLDAASRMRQAVQGAAHVLSGVMPELLRA